MPREVYSAWHLNLWFSSVEESDRRKIIDRCYWPLLEIIDRSKRPQGIEISGASLRVIAKESPSWISEVKRLCTEGKVEILASGEFQIIAPLAPASINRENLISGQRTYRDILEVDPRVAFANEQCVSMGYLAELENFGYEAAIVEWENAWAANPKWSASTGRHPAKIEGLSGLRLIWNHSRLFQGLQKFVHGQMTERDYRGLYADFDNARNSAACFYGGDAETFNYRTGRFATESSQTAEEWLRVETAMSWATAAGANWVLPSNVSEVESGIKLSPFSLDNQIITKKQPKYNALRWAAAGRNNYKLNSYAAHQLSAVQNIELARNQGLKAEILSIWSSDLRTHITKSRWLEFQATNPLFPLRSASGSRTKSRGKWYQPAQLPGTFSLENDSFSAILNTDRGMCIESITPNCGCGESSIGHAPFGLIPGPKHSPDWFTANMTYQVPGQHQETDLRRPDRIWISGSGGEVGAYFMSQSFALRKTVSAERSPGGLCVRYEFFWRKRAPGTLRVGHVTFLPSAWEWDDTHFITHNGGTKAEAYKIEGDDFDHGSPVSSLVSASNCAGHSEGFYQITDRSHLATVTVGERSRGAALMLSLSTGGEKRLFRTFYSLEELDDTHRPRSERKTEFEFQIALSCMKDR